MSSLTRGKAKKTSWGGRIVAAKRIDGNVNRRRSGGLIGKLPLLLLAGLAPPGRSEKRAWRSEGLFLPR
jgi:hypothetical protein